jgi:anti-anti-sigma regulatory factor
VPGTAHTAATVILVADDQSEVVLGALGAELTGLALVDALMRFRLEARRHGMEVCLRDVCDELRGLLELVGLDGVLALEPRRQPEGLEQLGVDEVVQPGDPGGRGL